MPSESRKKRAAVGVAAAQKRGSGVCRCAGGGLVRPVCARDRAAKYPACPPVVVLEGGG